MDSVRTSIIGRPRPLSRQRRADPDYTLICEEPENSRLSGLSIYASGTFPVELSVGKRISGRHRVPLRASVEISTGEVSFHVDPEGIKILQNDAGDH